MVEANNRSTEKHDVVVIDLVFEQGEVAVSEILEGKGQLKHRQEGRGFIRSRRIRGCRN